MLPVISANLTPEQLLSEIEDLLRTMPAQGNLAQASMEHMEWFGRAASLFSFMNSRYVVSFKMVEIELFSELPGSKLKAVAQLLALIHDARNTLTLMTRGPRSNVIGQGGVFDYFDEVRKIVLTAQKELFFIDPYMDSEFVSRFLRPIPSAIQVRLLCKNLKSLSTLVPAVKLLSQQNRTPISVRTIDEIHDRYVIVDGTTCFQSGASFKDGAKNSSTLLTQIVDAFDPVRSTYENLWSKAHVQVQ